VIAGIDIGFASRRLMILLLSRLNLGVVWSVKRPGIGAPRRSLLEVTSPDPALVMLKDIYAHGAITKEQFEKARRDLAATAPTTPERA
jgi:uncharacterized membrane protein